MLSVLRPLTVLLALAAAGVASDLRIETRVFAEDEDQPVCQSVTLFSSGAVFDFRDERPIVVIYRPGTPGKPGRFVLLDTERKIRTELTTDRIDGAIEGLRKWAAQSEDEFLRFTGQPSFVESFNEETGELELIGEQLSYRLVTQPIEKPESKLAVRQFLDSFSKLQTLLETSLPPDPRLRVNEALFRHGVMPVETRLYSGAQEEPSLRAEHFSIWMLSRSDRERIDKATDQMVSFQAVSNEEFRHKETLAAKE